MKNKKIVMYLPHRGDPGRGELISADLLPLEFVQIAGPALERGWEVELIDAMVEPRPLERVLAACADASVFCSSLVKTVLVPVARWRMRTGFFTAPYEFKAYHRARQLLDKLWKPAAAAS